MSEVQNAPMVKTAVIGNELANDPPLVVDLDGTLVKTDLLLESMLQLLRRYTYLIVLLPLWLMRGKSTLKSELASRVSIEPALLPYHLELLGFLHDQHARGRLLVLATASHASIAKAIASHLAIFSEVIATQAGCNVAGRNKRDVLVDRFGKSGFDYAGNARPDLHIWPCARNAILVNPEPGVAARACRITNIAKVFDDRKPEFHVLLRALRVHQWLKNLLVFLPLLAAHLVSDPHAIAMSVLAFISFCAAASAVYLLNDALDLESDRNHPKKRFRPFASGDLPIGRGALYGLALAACSLAIAASISLTFLATLFAYLLLTTAYSLYIKTYVLLDVICLASLYTLRVIAGAVAITVVPSFWLLAFSMFVFFSLALIKRCAELHALADCENGSARGRDYAVVDLRQLTGLGAAAANAAAVILALYLNSPDVLRQYTHPQLLWLLCPLLMYWLGRMWIKCGRGQMDEDPIVFSSRDRASWLIAFASAILVILAT